MTFHIFLESNMFKMKTKWEITTWKFIQARAEFLRTLLDKRAEFSPRTDADRQGVKEKS